MTAPDPNCVDAAQRAELEIAPGVVVGEVIADKYRIEGLVGRGGMGIVVAASQLNLNRRVAIKLICEAGAHEPIAVARLLREAKAAARIQSEHSARVLDVGTLADGAPFIVMEYLEGLDLDTLIRRQGPLPIGDAVDFLLQACEAVAEAHRNGIVHRDLKPANIFIARQPGGLPCVKVVDFGISKFIGDATSDEHALESLTQPSRVLGSLGHMAPEQMRGKPVDARTDVWALGVVLFEMLAGRKLFGAASWADACAQILNDSDPARGLLDQIPEELAKVIATCLRRAADERYANVAELATALAPFGKSTARASLERIVLLAAFTPHPAELWTPAPLASAAAAVVTSQVPRETSAAVTPVLLESALGSETKDTLVATSHAIRPSRPLLIGSSVGVALIAAAVAWFVIAAPRASGPEERSVQALAPDTPRASTSANTAPAIVAAPVPAPSVVMAESNLPPVVSRQALKPEPAAPLPVPATHAALPVPTNEVPPTAPQTSAPPPATPQISAAPQPSADKQPSADRPQQALDPWDVRQFVFKPKRKIPQ